MPLNGIDVSEYQPADIGARVGYDFLIAQATNGERYVAPDYRAQVDAALNRGKLAGLYHFAEGGSIAREVAAFAAAVKPYAGRVVPVLDWEGSALNAGAAWRQGFLAAAQSELGVRPMLYGSLSVVGAVQGETLWTAAYGSNPVTNGYASPSRIPGVMRQYCSQGRLAGYAGDLDLNVFWGSAADWLALAGTKPETQPLSIGDEMKYIYSTNRGGALVGPNGFYPIANATEAEIAYGVYGGVTLSDAQWDYARQTALNLGAMHAPTAATVDVAALAAELAKALPAPTSPDGAQLAADVVAGLAKALGNG